MVHNKIIFLDIDGVINNIKTRYDYFDVDCLERIKTIINASNAKVVISSSWREGDLDLTKKHFPDWLQEHIVGETVRGYHYVIKGSSLPIVRGNEIKHWLDRNVRCPWHANPEMSKQYEMYTTDPDGKMTFRQMKINKLNEDYTYVIIDDDSDMLYEQRNNFVHTQTQLGIQDEHVEQAIKILNKI